LCAGALIIVSKAGASFSATLQELIYSVRLENATRYGPNPNTCPEPPAAEPVLTTKNFRNVFDAVLDPFFDEDVYMGTDEMHPAMPLGAPGDH
jgi:hypothetical protein